MSSENSALKIVIIPLLYVSTHPFGPQEPEIRGDSKDPLNRIAPMTDNQPATAEIRTKLAVKVAHSRVVFTEQTAF